MMSGATIALDTWKGKRGHKPPSSTDLPDNLCSDNTSILNSLND